jgi:hypothetical protein
MSDSRLCDSCNQIHDVRMFHGAVYCFAQEHEIPNLVSPRPPNPFRGRFLPPLVHGNVDSTTSGSDDSDFYAPAMTPLSQAIPLYPLVEHTSAQARRIANNVVIGHRVARSLTDTFDGSQAVNNWLAEMGYTPVTPPRQQPNVDDEGWMRDPPALSPMNASAAFKRNRPFRTSLPDNVYVPLYVLGHDPDQWGGLQYFMG